MCDGLWFIFTFMIRQILDELNDDDSSWLTKESKFKRAFTTLTHYHSHNSFLFYDIRENVSFMNILFYHIQI